MSLIERMLKQKAVYWAPAGLDQHGQPTYASPVEIRCRWEVDDHKETKDPMGERVDVEGSRVYVDRDLALHGWIMLGPLTGGMDPNPLNHREAWDIQRFEKAPRYRTDKFLRSVYL